MSCHRGCAVRGAHLGAPAHPELRSSRVVRSCTSTTKEIPTEYLGNTLVLEYPTQVLEIAIVDWYSIKVDLEVRTVYKTKDRPSFKIRVLLLLVLALHAVRLSPVALHTHDTTLVMSSVMEQSFCVKSAVRV